MAGAMVTIKMSAKEFDVARKAIQQAIIKVSLEMDDAYGKGEKALGWTLESFVTDCKRLLESGPLS